jgi:hypothetical protein
MRTLQECSSHTPRAGWGPPARARQRRPLLRLLRRRLPSTPRATSSPSRSHSSRRGPLPPTGAVAGRSAAAVPHFSARLCFVAEVGDMRVGMSVGVRLGSGRSIWSDLRSFIRHDACAGIVRSCTVFLQAVSASCSASLSMSRPVSDAIGSLDRHSLCNCGQCHV